MSDQKKRTWEALQQQYTAAKTMKLQDEQLKSRKKNNLYASKPKFGRLVHSAVPYSVLCMVPW
jgi:ribonuclease P protein subunit POP4